VLSIFDGIGSAALALRNMGVHPQVWAWETDKLCIEVVKRHVPDTKHMGEFNEESIHTALHEVEK
jgi:site-specific DNA-cytosine methylase